MENVAVLFSIIDNKLASASRRLAEVEKIVAHAKRQLGFPEYNLNDIPPLFENTASIAQGDSCSLDGCDT